MMTKNVKSPGPQPPSLKEVRRRIESEFRDVQAVHPRILGLALNEAEAVAAQTDFPHLLFPALAREKAEGVAAWHQRQKRIRAKNRIVSFAA